MKLVNSSVVKILLIDFLFIDYIFIYVLLIISDKKGLGCEFRMSSEFHMTYMKSNEVLTPRKSSLIINNIY